MGTGRSRHSLEMTQRTFFTVSSLLVALVACGGQVTSLGSVGDETGPGGNGTNGAGTDSTTSDQSGTWSGSSSGSSGSVTGSDGGAADTGGGGGSGKACNPFVASPSSQCPTGEYCEADAPGTSGIGKCVINPKSASEL